MTTEDRKRFEQALSGTILGIFPPKIIDDSRKVYAYEDSVLNTAKKWIPYIEENKTSELINALIDGIEKLITTDDFESTVMKFTNSHYGDQVLIANYLKNMIHTEEINLDTIWKAINDSKWREAAFRKSHHYVLQLIFDALNEIEGRYQEKWAYNLPHFYALECEERKDEKRKGYLFACTVHSSLCGNTTSGIEKLLKGENKYHYHDYIENWRARLEDSHKWAPEWVKARIRPVLAVLYP